MPITQAFDKTVLDSDVKSHRLLRQSGHAENVACHDNNHLRAAVDNHIVDLKLEAIGSSHALGVGGE